MLSLLPFLRRDRGYEGRGERLVARKQAYRRCLYSPGESAKAFDWRIQAWPSGNTRSSGERSITTRARRRNKSIPCAEGWDKEYHFSIVWGEHRTTGDGAGTVIATSSVRPARDSVEEILPQFVGKIKQVPPIYSAQKVGNTRIMQKLIHH